MFIPRLNFLCLSLTAVLTISSGIGVVAAESLAGKKCPAKGATFNLNNVRFTCTKVGKKLVWDKGVPLKAVKPKETQAPALPTATSSPSPTSLASPKTQVRNLDITPVFTMKEYSETRSTSDSGKLSIIRDYGFVEITIPTFSPFDTSSEYFVVNDKNFLFNWGVCTSGQVFLYKDRRSETRGSTLYALHSRSAKGIAMGTLFKIPSTPLTFRCDFFGKTPYSLYLIETRNDGKTIVGSSRRFDFITPQLREIATPTPTPTPSVSSGTTSVANALCAPEGAVAKSAEGTTLTCKSSVGDGQLRWTP